MKLFRAFGWDGRSRGAASGGPLFVPRVHQGSGRHDNPELYGAFYCALDPVSAVAEALQPFRNQSLEEGDFVRGKNRRLALSAFEVTDSILVFDLDDPSELARRSLRPSRVATFDRTVTQDLAAALFTEGGSGFLWWSVLESQWINATLFAERVTGSIRLLDGPRQLGPRDYEVSAAARRLGIQIG